MAHTFLYASTPQFKAIMQRTIDNAKLLRRELQARGFKILSDGTDTHLLVIDMRDRGLSGQAFADALEKIKLSVYALVWGIKYPQIAPTVDAMPGTKCFIAAVIGGLLLGIIEVTVYLQHRWRSLVLLWAVAALCGTITCGICMKSLRNKPVQKQKS